MTDPLVALDAQGWEDLNRLAASEAEGRTLQDGRAAAIRATVAADPAYAAPDTGLVALLHRLKVLAADPWVGAVVLLLEVFFAGIELAAVFAKLLSFVPMAYATRLAREDQLRQIAIAREVAAVLATPARPMDRDPAPGSDCPPGTPTAIGAPADADPVAVPAASPEIDHWERGAAAHPRGALP